MPPVSWPRGFHLLHLGELFTGALECILGFALLGDVAADPEQAHHASAIVLDDLDLDLQIAHFAAGAQDTTFAPESLSRFARGDEFLLHALAVVGMDHRDEILESAGELAGLHAVDLAELVRPGRRVVFNVAHPAPELG